MSMDVVELHENAMIDGQGTSSLELVKGNGAKKKMQLYFESLLSLQSLPSLNGLIWHPNFQVEAGSRFVIDG